MDRHRAEGLSVVGNMPRAKGQRKRAAAPASVSRSAKTSRVQPAQALDSDEGGSMIRPAVVPLEATGQGNIVFGETSCATEDGTELTLHYGNVCYTRYQDRKKSWFEARQACENLGGQLAKLTVWDVLRNIARMQKDVETYWIGGKEKNGKYYWMDGEPMAEPGHWDGLALSAASITSWFTGEDLCAATLRGFWYKKDCDSLLFYMCERGLPNDELSSNVVSSQPPDSPPEKQAFASTALFRNVNSQAKLLAVPMQISREFSTIDCARKCVEFGVCRYFNFQRESGQCLVFHKDDTSTLKIENADGWTLWDIILDD